MAPVVSAMYKMWTLRRRMRRFMEDPFGQSAYGAPRGFRDARRPHTETANVRKGKKIPRDVGEYVAFTEYESHTDTSAAGKERRAVRAESQITDVEWVDIDK